MRSKGYGTWSVSVCMCVCICLSVKSHLISGAPVRPENTLTYLAGNGGQNTLVGFSLKLLRFRDPAFPPLKGYTYSQPFSFWRLRIHMTPSAL